MNFLFLIISTSILMSLIILLALALFSFFPEQFSGKTRYFIWIIILIGLIIPVRPIIGNGLITIELPWQTESLEVLEAQLAEEAAANNITTENPSNISNESTVNSNANVTSSESLAPSSNSVATDTPNESIFDLMKKNLTPIAVILGIWLLGAFFSFSRHIYHYYQFKKMVRRWSKPVEDLATLELFDIVKEDMGLHKKNIQLMVCPSITTPMLTGFFKPTILLPNKEIHEDEMELILEHELTHYKHKDLYINLLGTLAVSLHWFNPIVYLCYPSIQGDGEVCCDEAVLKNHDSDYRQFYGEVIISMIERNSKNQVAFTTCFYAKKLSIKRRLMAIMKTNKNKKLSFIAIALILTLTIISGSVIAFAAPARKKYISTNKAKAIALRDAGLKSKDVKFVKVRLETENGIKVYDVEFYKGQTEYDYDIDALTGRIVSKDLDIENFEIPGGNNNQNNSQLIGLEKAKSIALTDAGLKANQVTFRKAKLDKDDGRQVYDIEFTTSSAKYEYEIDALTGKIRDKEVKAVKNNNNNNNNNSNSNQVIGLEKAKNIALADARLKANQVTFVKAKLEKEDGRQVYDVEFYFGQTEYDYEIDALTGKILEKDLDIDNFNIPNQNNNNNTQVIGVEKAKNIALADAGLKANQVTFIKAKLDNDDGKQVYDVEFYFGQTEYDYEIDALTGKILEKDLDIDNFNIPNQNNNNNTQVIGLEKAKNIALADAGLKANQVTFIKAKLDNDDGKQVYDVEFYFGQTEYDYEIDALTGKILEKDLDIDNFNIPNQNNNNNTQVIGVEKAKNIALADAGLKANQVTFVKAKLDNDDGRQVYDVEFYFGQTEYDYEIDALTGKILEKDLDIDNFNIPNQNNNNNASQAISLEQAKGIALNHAGLSANQVQFKKARLTKDDGRDVFEIEFRANHVEYDYEIDALSGKILDFDQEREDD